MVKFFGRFLSSDERQIVSIGHGNFVGVFNLVMAISLCRENVEYFGCNLMLCVIEKNALVTAKSL